MRVDPTKHLSYRDLESPIRNFSSPFIFTFTFNQTVEEVLRFLQTTPIDRKVEHVYITDNENVLVGMLDAVDLLYNPPSTLLIDIMDPDVVKVNENEPLEKGLRLITAHKTLILAVIDAENRFSGVLEISIHHGELYYNEKKEKEDIFQFLGFSIEQKQLKSPLTEYKYRMPWLLCNLIGGLACAIIGELFKQTVLQFIVLAFFIPLVLTLSESVSIQSMTLSLRFLHVRKIYWLQVWRRIWAESKSSFLLGITSALFVTIFYFIWTTQVLPMIAIGTSIIVTMVVSAIIGGLFPILLHILKLDPKVAAGPITLMTADIITITIYLGLSTLILIKHI